MLYPYPQPKHAPLEQTAPTVKAGAQFIAAE
jgi:hypothetical protein